MRTAFLLLATRFLMTLTASLPVLGQRPGGDQRSKGVEQEASLEQRVEAFTQALRRLEASVLQLENKVDQLVDQPSEFSRVEVRVVDQSQQPISGFKVELDSADRAQHASASGVSDDSGLAVTRHLPYGKYRLSVRGRRWQTADLVTVEVDKPFEVTVVAPSPDRRATLVLQPAISVDRLRGLHFGSWQLKDRGDASWATQFAPEPDGADMDLVEEETTLDDVESEQQASDPWQTFPTISDGIEKVGLLVEFRVKRQTEQSAGIGTRWRWDRRAAEHDNALPVRWLVQSGGTVQPVLEMSERRTKISEKSGPFAALATQENESSERRSRDERLGYYRLTLGQQQQGEADVELPAGQITASVEELYGRPSDQVLQAIGLPRETDQGELWLRAVVENDSQWFDRIVGGSKNVEDRSSAAGEFEVEIELAAGQREELRIGHN